MAQSSEFESRSQGHSVTGSDPPEVLHCVLEEDT